jgi:hypothetical protein
METNDGDGVKRGWSFGLMLKQSREMCPETTAAAQSIRKVRRQADESALTARGLVIGS